MEQLELDSPDLSEGHRSRTVLVSEAGDSLPPVVIEVVVEKDGPVSLELLTKLLIIGVVFLATRHLPTSLAIVSALLSTFIPDVIRSMIGRRKWGKKRVGILTALFGFFATIDSAFGKAIGRRVASALQHVRRPARGGAQKALGMGHAAATSAAAALVCAAAIAVPAVASGGSPFAGGGSSHTSASSARPVASHTSTSGVQALQGPTQPQVITSTGRTLTLRVGVSSAGVSGSVALRPGQAANLEFTLAQTSKVIFAVDQGSTLGGFAISHDNAQNPTDNTVYADNPYILETLPAGAHTITIEPDATNSGTLRFTLYANTAQFTTSEISPAGVSGSLTLTPGQIANVQFNLNQPSKVIFAVDQGSTLGGFAISHDNAQNPADNTVYNGNPYILETLPSGAHTITIEPDATNSGTLHFTLYANTAQFTTSEISPAGVSGSLTLTPGQIANVQFNLSQPSKVIFAVDQGSTLGGFAISHDNAQNPTDNTVYADSPYILETLPAGAHTITIEPDATSSGTLRFTLASPQG